MPASDLNLAQNSHIHPEDGGKTQNAPVARSGSLSSQPNSRPSTLSDVDEGLRFSRVDPTATHDPSAWGRRSTMFYGSATGASAAGSTASSSQEPPGLHRLPSGRSSIFAQPLDTGNSGDNSVGRGSIFQSHFAAATAFTRRMSTVGARSTVAAAGVVIPSKPRGPPPPAVRAASGPRLAAQRRSLVAGGLGHLEEISESP